MSSRKSRVLETFFSLSRIEELKPIKEENIHTILWEYHIFSQDEVFIISINFIQGHLRLNKELNFYRLQNWKKSFVQGLNFVPQLALVPQLSFPPTGTSFNWHFFELFFVSLRIWVPQLPVHHFPRPSYASYKWVIARGGALIGHAGLVHWLFFHSQMGSSGKEIFSDFKNEYSLLREKLWFL